MIEQPARKRLIAALVVTSTLAVVAWLLIRQATELDRRLQCAANLKGFGTAIELQHFPNDQDPIAIIDQLIQNGVIDETLTRCPTSRHRYQIRGLVEGANSNPSIVTCFEVLENHGDGANVLFADGHATFVKEDEYHELIK